MVIQNASTKIIDDYKSRFGAQVLIAPDFQKVFQNSSPGEASLPRISQDQQKQIAGSSHVKEWSAIASEPIATLAAAKAVDADAKENMETSGSSIQSASGEGAAPIAQLLATTNLLKEEKFSTGVRSIIEGSAPQSDGEVLISKEFANANKLKVGDPLDGDSPRGMDSQGKANRYNLKITGIYGDTSSAYPAGFPAGLKEPMLNNRNEMYTTFNTVLQNYTAKGSEVADLKISYILKSPDLLDSFKKDVEAAGVDLRKWTFRTDLDSYNNIVKPVESMRGLATTFLIVVLILGAGILVLISMIAVRERKYEVGVLRAMGMPKRKVLAGFLTESVALTVAALLVALPIAFLAAKPVAAALLSSQNDAYTNSSQAAQPSASNGVVIVGNQPGEGSSMPSLTSLDVSLDLNSVLQLGLLSLLLAALASVIGIVVISRFEPIKILSDRN
ncbi:ABC transporter permease [Paenarthrobacter histidinolovorans]